MEPHRGNLNRILTELCKIHPEGGQVVIEHILRIVSPKEFENLQETISHEVWLIQEERKRMAVQTNKPTQAKETPTC